MTRTKVILSIAFMSCLLLSVRAYSQEPGGHSGAGARESRLQLSEAEIEVKMHELELAMSESAVVEATLECEKLKLRVEAAEEQADSRELAFAKLELEQAKIRVEMRKVQSEMARLRIKAATARLAYGRAALTGKPGKSTRVQLEYVDDLDIVVIRGAKESVDKITALIEGAKKERKEKE